MPEQRISLAGLIRLPAGVSAAARPSFHSGLPEADFNPPRWRGPLRPWQVTG